MKIDDNANLASLGSRSLINNWRQTNFHDSPLPQLKPKESNSCKQHCVIRKRMPRNVNDLCKEGLDVIKEGCQTMTASKVKTLPNTVTDNMDGHKNIPYFVNDPKAKESLQILVESEGVHKTLGIAFVDKDSSNRPQSLKLPKSPEMSARIYKQRAKSENEKRDRKSSVASNRLEAVPEDPQQSGKKKRVKTLLGRSHSSLDLPTTSNQIPRRTRASFQATFINTVKLFSRRGSRSNPGTPRRSQVDNGGVPWNDALSWSNFSTSSKSPTSDTSYYKSYEDLTFEPNQSQNPELAKVPNGANIRTTANYVGDAWCEVNAGGGTVQIPGTDVSLHISRNTAGPSPSFDNRCSCLKVAPNKRHRSASVSKSLTAPNRRSSANKKHRSPTSGQPVMQNFSCPGPDCFDGRIVLGLCDPPEIQALSGAELNDGTLLPMSRIAYAGPSVRVSFGAAEMADMEAVLKINTTVKFAMLHGDGDSVSNGNEPYSTTCLQSESPNGPYTEVKVAFQFGATLQVTLNLNSLKTDSLRDIYVVPLIKANYSYNSPWDLIASQSICFALYGLNHTYAESVCCLSVSATGFCPPFLNTIFKSARICLRRWDSFILPSRCVQGFDLAITNSEHDHFTFDAPGDKFSFKVSEEDLCTSPRATKTFVLQCSQEILRCPPGTDVAFKLTATGQKDGKARTMITKVPRLKQLALPPISGEVAKRLNFVQLAIAASLEAETKDVYHQWVLCQVDQFSIRPHSYPVATERTVCPARLVVAMKGKTEKRKQSLSNPNMVQFSQGDILAVLSERTLIVENDLQQVECWIVYSHHKTGLIPTSCTRSYTFEDFFNWSNVRPVAKSIIDAVTEPVQFLSYAAVQLCNKLISRDLPWENIMNSIMFGKNFMDNALKSNLETYLKKEIISHFLAKYKEYCSRGPRQRFFHQEIVKSLLYCEEYDFATELLTDFSLMSVALALGPQWHELVRILNENGKISGNENTLVAKLEPWKPALTFLNSWRDSLGDDMATLRKLHKALNRLNDGSRRTLSHLTACIVAVSSIDVLRCSDTRL